jgi:amino-acid N-acetyltransferase
MVEAAATPAVGPAGAGDLDEVEALLRRCDLPVEGLREHASSLVVARRDGRGGPIVGCAAAELYGRACVLRSLAVAHEARGSGLWRALVDAVLQRARVAGCTEAYLLTTTIEALAARQGFVRIARSEVDPAAARSVQFRLTQCDSAAVMRRPL